MWKLERTDDKKYPYRISINKGDKINLQFFSQKKWPEAEQSVFCIRAESKPDIKLLEIIEEIPIVSARCLEGNTKISLVLERNNNKKCEFRFVKKPYKNKTGEYDQIFFKSKSEEKVASIWEVRETDSSKFPYCISIVENNKKIFSLVTQDKWAGASGNIFCIRTESKSEIAVGKIIEEIPIILVKRIGKRLTVVLDRSSRKRCEFLFLEKKYKTKEGKYEQIFFRTQQGITQHRTRGKLSLQPKDSKLEVIIDSNERYPWRFGEHNTNKKKLVVGDYALTIENEIVAIVERKTFDNMLSDIARIQVLHQQLSELSSYPHAAVIIEAQYGDFFIAEKIREWKSVAHIGRALAELSVIHNNLPIIYAGNRKEANHWALRFFEAVLKKQSDPTNDAIAKAIAKTRTSKSNPLWLKVKKVIIEEMPDRFQITDLKNQLPSLTDQQIRNQLYKLCDESIIKKEGKARTTVWCKMTNHNIEL